jgi:conjugal transfer mating pair stabilization protein TraG
MDNLIVTYGGGEIFHYIFQGIAMFFGSGSGLIQTLSVTTLIGFNVALLRFASNGDFRLMLTQFFWVIFAMNILLLPKSSLWIKDPVSHKQYKVDNLPSSFVLLVSYMNSLGRYMTVTVEKLFTLPDYMPYQETGVIFASEMISNANRFKIIDPDFNMNMERFVNRCVVFDAMIGSKYSMKDLQNSDDIWQLVSSKASNILGFSYRDPGNENKIVTCREGANLLNQQWAGQIDLAAKHYGKKILSSHGDQAKTEFLKRLPQSFSLLTGIADDAQNILRQEMMMNALKDGPRNKMSEFNNGSNYAATKAILHQRSTYEIASSIAKKTLPIMKTLFEALTYVAVIFIIIMLFLIQGWKVLGSYISLVFWVQLWAPLYAILNLIMTLTAQTKSTAIAGQGLNLITSVGLSDFNADMNALAGWLSVSVPAVSWILIKGGAQAFSHVAGHIGSAMQHAASSTAGEVVSGNISLGNVSAQSQNYKNHSSFQNNSSALFKSGQFEQNMEDGMQKTTQMNGNQTDRGGAGVTKSIYATSGMESNSLSSSLQKQSSEEHAKGDNESIAANESRSVAQRHLTDLVARDGKSVSTGVSNSSNTSLGSSDSFSKARSVIGQISESTGISRQKVAEAYIGASINSNKSIAGKLAELTLGVSGNAGAKASTTGAISDNYSKADQIIEQNGGIESYDKLARAAIEHRFSENSSEDKSLQDGFGASYEETARREKSSSAYHQNGQRLSNTKSMADSSSFDLRTDRTDALKNYMTARQEQQGDPLAQDNAGKIMDATEGRLYAKKAQYLKDYNNDFIDSIKTQNFDTPESLQAAYQNHVASIPQNIEGKYKQNKSQIEQKASDDYGISRGKVVNHEVKDKIELDQFMIAEKYAEQKIASDQQHKTGKQVIDKKMKDNDSLTKIAKNKVKNAIGWND